jgi:REP element-mobilizing transposase RayT
MTTDSTSLANWIQSNMDTDNAERWFPLTFRVDSVIHNAQHIVQSPWSKNPTQAFQSVHRALDWTITELRRYHKGLQFVSWVGGNEAVGVRSHIHAIIRVPDDQDVMSFIDRLQTIWKRNLAKTLKTEVKASVWTDTQPLRSGSSFSHYASRSEAGDIVRGMDKVNLGRSFFLKQLAT